MIAPQNVSSLRVWLTAARPFAYTASALAVVLGLAIAHYSGYPIRWGLFAVTLLGVLCFHTAANLLMKDWEFGIRYAMVKPDSNMAYTKTTAATTTTPSTTTLYPITDSIISEITPSIAYYVHQYGLKFIADVAIQLDVPLSIEEDHGLYNLMLQPDSVSYISSGGVELQDTYIAKLMVQYEF